MSRARLIGLIAAAALMGTSTAAYAASRGDDRRYHPSPQHDVTVLHTLHGPTASGYGGAVSQLADIDRDGAQDLIIGSPRFSDPTGVVGLVEVRSGRTGALLFALHGQPGDRFGYAITDGGDIDGDHVNDIAVGAPGIPGLACVSGTNTGKVYVFSGRTGTLVRTFPGLVAADQFGAALAGVGDLNRDGRGDLVVGSPCADAAAVDAGAAYVISGRDGRVLRTHLGSAAGDGFGWGVGNLPGGPDYVIGAKDGGSNDSGVATVYDGRRGTPRFTLHGDGRAGEEFGWFFVGNAGDVNRDHRNDIYVGDFCAADATNSCAAPRGIGYVFSGKDGRLLWRFVGAQDNDGSGPGRAAGDVDRDDYDDIVVGSYTSSAAASFGGRIVVYSGRTGKPIRAYSSPVPGELLGFDAVGVGDVNRDGHADLLVSGQGSATVYVLST